MFRKSYISNKYSQKSIDLAQKNKQHQSQIQPPIAPPKKRDRTT